MVYFIVIGIRFTWNVAVNVNMSFMEARSTDFSSFDLWRNYALCIAFTICKLLFKMHPFGFVLTLCNSVCYDGYKLQQFLLCILFAIRLVLVHQKHYTALSSMNKIYLVPWRLVFNLILSDVWMQSMNRGIHIKVCLRLNQNTTCNPCQTLSCHRFVMAVYK